MLAATVNAVTKWNVRFMLFLRRRAMGQAVRATPRPAVHGEPRRLHMPVPKARSEPRLHADTWVTLKAGKGRGKTRREVAPA